MRKVIRAKIPKALSVGEETLALQLNAEGIKFHREWKFHPERKWRFDFALPVPATSLAVEVEGGAYTKSRHTTGKGFTDDCVKYSEAAALGWRVLRFTTEHVASGYAIDCIKRAIVGWR